VILALGLGNPLHLYTAARAVNPPHSVDEKHENAPKLNKLKAPYRQGVITGAREIANRTYRKASLSWLNFDFKEQLRCLFNQNYSAAHETIMLLHSI
jgi:hypothetical protein